MLPIGTYSDVSAREFSCVNLRPDSDLHTRYHGRYPWTIEAVFKQYGDVVRIAPNELAFFTVEAQSGSLSSIDSQPIAQKAKCISIDHII